MLLWTIQHREAYEVLLEKGYLRADDKYLPDGDCFARSYRWMSEQMQKRLSVAPHGVTYPVWAWYQWEGKRKRPDMRTHNKGYGAKGTPIVLLTVDVPEKFVLLSDFDYWHFVLNDMPLRFDENGEIEECPETEKQDSWEKIFDFTYRYPGDEDMPLSTQATLWEITKEWVLKAEHFISR